MKLKKLFVASAIAVPLVATMAIVTQPAHASTDANPIQCSGEMCVQTQSVSGSTASVRAWAESPYHFTGHFQMQAPNGGSWNSPGGDKLWTSNQGYTFTENGGTGNWCATEWDINGSGGYIKGGYKCVAA